MDSIKMLLSENIICDWKFQVKVQSLLEDFCYYQESEAFASHLTHVKALLTRKEKGALKFQLSSIPYFCVIYTMDGICELTYDGFSYSLRKNSIVFLDMAKGFSISLAQSNDWQFSLLIIEGKDCPFFYSHFYQDKIAGFFLPPVSNIPNKMHTLYTLMETSGSDTSCHFITHKLLTDIMTAIIMEQRTNPITDEVFPNHVVNTLVYIDHHYMETFTLDDISGSLNISKFSLAHDFKRYIGKSIMDYVCEKRMTRAKELLSNTEESIGEIGFQIGFSSDAYFISTFKKKVGITPLKYRKQHNIHSYGYILNT